MFKMSQFTWYKVSSIIELVFLKDVSLYFTKRDYERRRCEIVITSAKHEAERSKPASEGSIHKI